jgi:hypothetical protein
MLDKVKIMLYTEGKVKIPTSARVFILTLCIKIVNSVKEG